jgi:hypothetical protein
MVTVNDIIMYMKNYIEFDVYDFEVKELISRYRDSELRYLGSKPSLVRGRTIVSFQGARDVVAESGTDASRRFIEFDDGTVSPLYVKRERDYNE